MEKNKGAIQLEHEVELLYAGTVGIRPELAEDGVRVRDIFSGYPAAGSGKIAKGDSLPIEINLSFDRRFDRINRVLVRWRP